MMRVRCQICNLSRTHEKYARHLAFHVANREISSSAMKGILFQSKYSRKDKSVKKFNLSNGHTCGICGNIVQDLTRHLTKIHQIDSTSVKFSKLKDVSETCQRANHYKVTKQANVNPLFDYSKLSPVLIPKMLPDVIQNTTTSIPVLKSIFDYSDSEETQLMIFQILVTNLTLTDLNHTFQRIYYKLQVISESFLLQNGVVLSLRDVFKWKPAIFVE